MEGILSKFGFTDYEVMLSTRPEKSVGTDEIWDAATEVRWPLVGGAVLSFCMPADLLSPVNSTGPVGPPPPQTMINYQALVGALKRKGWEYDVDEGGGAFYGPKIDIKIRDAIGRCVLFFSIWAGMCVCHNLPSHIPTL